MNAKEFVQDAIKRAKSQGYKKSDSIWDDCITVFGPHNSKELIKIHNLNSTPVQMLEAWESGYENA